MVRGLPGQLRGAAATPAQRPDDVESNPFLELVTQIRRDTRAQLIDAIGESPMRELRAQGEAMDRDQATAYARSHISEHLATFASEAT